MLGLMPPKAMAIKGGYRQVGAGEMRLFGMSIYEIEPGSPVVAK